MAPLPPLTTPTAPKTLSRTARLPRPQGQEAGKPDAANQQAPRSFDKLDLPRAAPAKPAPPPSQSQQRPAPAQSPAQGAQHDQPQTFTLQTLSAIAGVLVANLEENSAPANAYAQSPDDLFDAPAEPVADEGATNTPPLKPGSRLNLSV